MSEKLWEKDGQSPNVDEQVEAFTVGNDYVIDAFILADDCWSSIAHAAGLARADILTTEELKKIQAALLNIIDIHERDGVAISRSQEDCHTTIEQLLIEALGDLGKKIHTGRSRNDQVLTALRLFTKKRLLSVGKALHQLSSRLLERAEAGKRIPMRGLSHTRPAMPTTLAVWLGGYVELLLDDAAVLNQAFDSNDRCPLGTAAGFGSVIPLDRDYTQQLLGFSEMQINALSCQTGRGAVEGTVIHALERIQGTLGTLASDLILFSTHEFGYVTIPHEFTTGSSIMPQKRNPDVLELIRAKVGVVAGAATLTRTVGSRLISGYHRDYQLLKEPLIIALATVEECLRIMERVVGEMEFDERALATSCTREIYAADIALEKSLRGIPFRDAYREALAELGDLKINDDFVASRINAYQTIGSMGRPSLDRYHQPLADLEAWLEKQQATVLATFDRLRGPLTA